MHNVWSWSRSLCLRAMGIGKILLQLEVFKVIWVRLVQLLCKHVKLLLSMVMTNDDQKLGNVHSQLALWIFINTIVSINCYQLLKLQLHSISCSELMNTRGCEHFPFQIFSPWIFRPALVATSSRFMCLCGFNLYRSDLCVFTFNSLNTFAAN